MPLPQAPLATPSAKTARPKTSARPPRAKRTTPTARKAVARASPLPAVKDPNSNTPLFDALMPRQKLFVQHWLTTFNGRRAAIAAGYSEATATEMASENLRKPHITAAIGELVKHDPRISCARIIEENAAIAFARPENFFRWGPGFVSIKTADEIPEECLPAIASLSETPGQFGNKITMTLHDKGGALDRLSKILKLVGDGKGDTNVNVNIKTAGVMIAPARMSEEEWFALAQQEADRQAVIDALPVIDHVAD